VTSMKLIPTPKTMLL
jgi:hypothetical protein